MRVSTLIYKLSQSDTFFALGFNLAKKAYWAKSALAGGFAAYLDQKLLQLAPTSLSFASTNDN